MIAYLKIAEAQIYDAIGIIIKTIFIEDLVLDIYVKF